MNVLALGAHPDDIEMGCGATLHKFSRDETTEVRFRVFSMCEDAVPPGADPRTLLEECKVAMGIIGADGGGIEGFPNKNLQGSRQAILDHLYELQNWPDVVFVCSTFNSHQDHNVVTQEAMRAFRGKAIYGYALPHSDYGFTQEAVYSVVMERDVDAKIKALQEYRSQFELQRPYFDLPYLKAIMRTAGGEIGKSWAEKFQNIRGII